MRPGLGSARAQARSRPNGAQESEKYHRAVLDALLSREIVFISRKMNSFLLVVRLPPLRGCGRCFAARLLTGAARQDGVVNLVVDIIAGARTGEDAADDLEDARARLVAGELVRPQRALKEAKKSFRAMVRRGSLQPARLAGPAAD